MKIPGEYIAVSKRLDHLGVWKIAYTAHQTSINAGRAVELTRKLTGITPSFCGYRGRAKRNANLITLPAMNGNRSDGVPYLRLGIVLHEAAHILTWRKMYPCRPMPHGMEFCTMLAKLLLENT